jgi:hypothetical protein
LAFFIFGRKNEQTGKLLETPDICQQANIWLNCQDSEISDGSIYAAGHWLDEEETEEFYEWLNIN